MDSKDVVTLAQVEERMGSLEDNGTDSSRMSEKSAVTHYRRDFRFVMTMLGLSMAFVVAEVLPLFLVTCFTVIAFDLGALKKVIWVLVAPYISTGAIAPFVGSLSDLIGRKAVLLSSLAITVVAMAICASAPTFGAYLCGGVLAGIGIGMQLLTTIAAASELVPVSQRGFTVGCIVLGFLPFASASLYGQMLTGSSDHGWRFIFVSIGAWAVLSLVVLAVFYRPPPRIVNAGMSKREILRRIDYVGCLLSVVGVTVLLVGINWGGNDYAWKSVQVICALTFGVFTLILFVIWELRFTKHPMFPMRLVQSKRHFVAVAVLCFTSGINYVPLTVFWTIQAYTVYEADFRQAGIYLMPLGWCIAGGAITSAIAMTVFKKHIQWVLLFFCIMQTVGMGCMSLANPENIKTVWAPMIFGLFGTGAVLLPSQVVFSVISPDDLIATSIALSLVIRMIGQVIGKSMLFNIFHKYINNRLLNHPEVFIIPAQKAGMPTVGSIEQLAKILVAGPLERYVKLFSPIDTPEKFEMIVHAGHELYKTAFPLLYKISVPFGALACVSCFALWGIDKFIDEHIALHL